MENSTSLSTQERTRLESLTNETRLYSEAAAMNMLQLGRVMTEAKTLVPHGSWTDWVQKNAHMSERQAQCLMQAWTRFGEMPGIESVEKSKIFKMLSLPEGTEKEFVESHRLSDMSTREVETAVRQAREEAKKQLDEEISRVRAEEHEKLIREKSLRIQAEERTARAEERANRLEENDGYSEEAARELEQLKAANEQLEEMARDAISEKNRMLDAQSKKDHEIAEMDEMLTSQQAELNRMQDELYAARSAMARGDAEREVSETLSADEIIRTVRQLIGTLSPAPYMGTRFSGWNASERGAVAEVISALEDWCAGTRRALNTVEGVIDRA